MCSSVHAEMQENQVALDCFIPGKMRSAFKCRFKYGHYEKKQSDEK